jgi:hypothetical protein
VRDSEIVVISRGLFDAVQHKHPMVVRHLIKSTHYLQGKRVLHGHHIVVIVIESSKARVHMTTVAIVAADEHVPMHQFATDLETALSEICL